MNKKQVYILLIAFFIAFIILISIITMLINKKDNINFSNQQATDLPADELIVAPEVSTAADMPSYNEDLDTDELSPVNEETTESDLKYGTQNPINEFINNLYKAIIANDYSNLEYKKEISESEFSYILEASEKYNILDLNNDGISEMFLYNEKEHCIFYLIAGKDNIVVESVIMLNYFDKYGFYVDNSHEILSIICLDSKTASETKSENYFMLQNDVLTQVFAGVKYHLEVEQIDLQGYPTGKITTSNTYQCIVNENQKEVLESEYNELKQSYVPNNCIWNEIVWSSRTIIKNLMPNVIGLTKGDAEELIKQIVPEAALDRYAGSNSNEYEAGYVMDQYPNEGVEIDKSSLFLLTISLGKEE